MSQPSDSDGSFDPSKNAASRFTSHVLQKGFQSGSVIGLVVVAPIMCWRSKSFSLSVVNKAAAYSSTVGTLLSGVMLGAKMKDMDKEGLEDRVYRLHYNEGQNRTDMFCQVGAAVGTGMAAVLVQASPLHLLGGAAVGSALGVAGHVITGALTE